MNPLALFWRKLRNYEKIDSIQKELEEIQVQLNDVLNKPPCNPSLKGFYWEYNAAKKRWEERKHKWLSYNDLRALNGVAKITDDIQKKIILESTE